MLEFVRKGSHKCQNLPSIKATALARIGEDGAVGSLQVPTADRVRWQAPRKVTSDKIEALLRAPDLS